MINVVGPSRCGLGQERVDQGLDEDAIALEVDGELLVYGAHGGGKDERAAGDTSAPSRGESLEHDESR